MFSVLLIFLVAVGFLLSIFLIILLLLNPKKYPQSIEPTVIVKLVDLHRQNLPLNSAHGWNLTPSNSGLRCWVKDLQFKVAGSPVSICACAKEMPCAAVMLLNVVADVQTWSDWDEQVQDQTVHLELPDNPSLHCDPYMQCDQVLITSKSKISAEVEMYRFGNLEDNGTCWILVWSAKSVDWILYVAQPIENSGLDNQDEERCMLTAMWGGSLKQEYLGTNAADILSRKVLNLYEAIRESQLKIRPFKSLLHHSSTSNPHFPTIHSALHDLPKKPCVLLEHEKKDKAYFKNGVLAVVPFSYRKPLSMQNTERFALILTELDTMNGGVQVSERRSRRKLKKRSDSISSSFSKKKNKSNSENRRSSSLTSIIRKKQLPELTVTKSEDQMDAKPPQRAFSHSLLHALFPRRRSSESSDHRSRSPSPNARNSLPVSKRRKFFKTEKTSSLSSQEDGHLSSLDLDVSDLSDVERSFFKRGDGMDFRALEEYAVTAVLQENLKVSLIDVNASEDEQKNVSGGWTHVKKSNSASVFKKITKLESCIFMSHLCKGIISESADTIWKVLCNPYVRSTFDSTIKETKILHEYSNGKKLVHICSKYPSSEGKETQDFCFLQAEKVEGSRHILGFQSVKDVICPPEKNVTRRSMVASGWLVEPVEGKKKSSKVSFLIQMMGSASDVNFMEGISDTQAECFTNLKIYLSN